MNEDMRLADETVVVALLAGLPRIGSKRLRIILEHHRPAEAVRRLAEGSPLHHMVERAIATDLAVVRSAAHALGSVERAAVDLADACGRAGIRMVSVADADFPASLRRDPDPPALLFVRGDVATLDRRRVGIIGTRNATGSGVATARDLGESLAAEGIAVVSGLARGIDGAAHEGVRRVDGAAVAVVGSGPDVPYPKHHAELWRWVSDSGFAPLRVRAGHTTRRVAVPPPQPHPRRTVRDPGSWSRAASVAAAC